MLKSHHREPAEAFRLACITPEPALRQEEAMALPFKEIVDLGHEYFDGMSNIGGSMVAFFPLETHEHFHMITSGKLSMEGRMILMPEHCGTHLDVPRHFVKDGADVNAIPLETLILPGHLLDLTHKKNGEAITSADLERAEEKSG